jgi:hypothetical protein
MNRQNNKHSYTTTHAFKEKDKIFFFIEPVTDLDRTGQQQYRTYYKRDGPVQLPVRNKGNNISGFIRMLYGVTVLVFWSIKDE